MSAEEILALLSPPGIDTANRKAVDLLNSRFNTLDDLENLELLVLDAQKRNDDLQSKLLLFQSRKDALVADTRLSAEAHIHTAQGLSLLRHSLIDELSELSHELTSSFSNGQENPTLLEDLETLHRSLKELQGVKGYIQVIEHALQLCETSAAQIRSSRISVSTSALNTYRALQDFVAKVSDTYSEVDDGSNLQTLNLVKLLLDIRSDTWLDMQKALESFLIECAEKIGWPAAIDYRTATTKDRAAFEQSFRNLLQLQSWGEKNVTSQYHGKDGLFPMKALVQPISLRFKYHFEGSRQTNRMDKPEWYFTHILNVIHEHRIFMESVAQSLIDSSEYRGINAQHEFTYLLLPIISRKLKHIVPSLSSHSSLLAHTIYQALAFDETLREEGFSILETSGAKQRNANSEWEGVSEVILGNGKWFETWLSGEQKFMDDQYHEITSSEDAWIIAADDHGDDSQPRDIKSTNSARRICSLVEQITDRYAALPHYEHRTRFVLDVQLPLLDHYYNRIVSSLDAFETLSSAFVRAVPGSLSVSLGAKEEGNVRIDSRGLTSGIEGVQRLGKALISAKYVETVIQAWGEEPFFMELWTEINRNGRALTSNLLPDPKTQGTEVPDDTLFDILISRYEHLVYRAESMIVQQVCGEIESVLKAHFSATSQRSGLDEIEESMALSQTLLAPVALLSSHLTFLRTIMSQTALITLYRKITSRLAEHLLQRLVLYRSQFSLTEGKVICTECELWVETCRTAMSGSLSGGRARLEAPWTRLLQAASLASAEGEVWVAVLEATFGSQNAEEWAAAVSRAVGQPELEREEVKQILRRREDCMF